MTAVVLSLLVGHPFPLLFSCLFPFGGLVPFGGVRGNWSQAPPMGFSLPLSSLLSKRSCPLLLDHQLIHPTSECSPTAARSSCFEFLLLYYCGYWMGQGQSGFVVEVARPRKGTFQVTADWENDLFTCVPHRLLGICGTRIKGKRNKGSMCLPLQNQWGKSYKMIFFKDDLALFCFFSKLSRELMSLFILRKASLCRSVIFKRLNEQKGNIRGYWCRW